MAIRNLKTGITIYLQHEVNIESIIECADRIVHKAGNPGRRNRPKIIDLVTCFDIETSKIQMGDRWHGFMYVWQWQFGDFTIMGRTWDEFLALVNRINKSLASNERLICYVHNLSYEFSYLKGIWHFEPADVFCMDSRKVARCNMDKIEFRCSYIHSNMSLALFCKKMQCKNQKLMGDLDYSVVRYPWTELTDEETAYCIMDVVALQEAIEREMEMDGDNLETIPLTSTGYIRRKCKEALKAWDRYPFFRADVWPDYTVFMAMREAFRGGNTHANRDIAGIIQTDVHSVDRSSSYPDVLVNHEYPISSWWNKGPIDMDFYRRYTTKYHRAAIIRISLFGVQLKNKWEPCPYIPWPFLMHQILHE